MTSFQSFDTIPLAGKRVLLRLDLNLPMRDGKILDQSRLYRTLPTLKELINKDAKIIILSHLGRPQGCDLNLSLSSIAEALQHPLPETTVTFCPTLQEAETSLKILENGHIIVLENLRFDPREEKNDMDFAKELASLGDVYINDAFSVSHRSHASVEAITHLLPSYPGRLLEGELKALHHVLEHPQKPLMAIVGGAKVSTKIDLLNNLIERVDTLVVGGAMANTFLLAQGHSIGKSLVEPRYVSTAEALLQKAKESDCELILPFDVTVAKDIKQNADSRHVPLDEVDEDELILDVGPQTVASIQTYLQKTKTLLWNGPLGIFEVSPFDQATLVLASTIADLTSQQQLISVAGGGDTLAALEAAKVTEKMTYVSAAGGAFLEWLEGKKLPGIEALKEAQLQL